MLKNLILICGLLAGLTAAYAAPQDDLRQELSALNSYSAEFAQVVVNREGREVLSAAGTLALSRPDNFMMHTLHPDETVLYTKDGDIYYYDPFVNQVSIFAKSQLESSPFVLLTSADAKVWERYEVSREGDSYALRPKTAQDILKIGLTFRSGLLSRLVLEMKDGSTNTYRFGNVQNRVGANAFRYQLPSDVQVDDERRR